MIFKPATECLVKIAIDDKIAIKAATGLTFSEYIDALKDDEVAICFTDARSAI